MCWKIWQWSCHYFYPVDGRFLFYPQKFSADSGLYLIMVNWKRYAHNLHTFSTGVLCIFPALLLHLTQLLNQIIIYFLDYNNFWLKFFEATTYFLNFLWVFIVLSVSSWVFKKSLLSCVLFKGCNVSLV